MTFSLCSVISRVFCGSAPLFPLFVVFSSKVMAAASTNINTNDAPEGDITLESGDDQQFTVPKKEAFLNEFIKDLFDPEDEGQTYPLPEVDGDILDLVNQFNHKTIENGTDMVKNVETFDEQQENDQNDKMFRSQKDEPWYNRVEAWYREFLDALPQPTLGRLLLASDYLRNHQLKMAVCMKIYSLHHQQPAEYTRELFFGENGLATNLEGPQQQSAAS